MGDELLDEKPAADPSPAATDDKGAPSSGAEAAAQEGVKTEESMQDVIKDAYEKATTDASPAEGEKAESDAESDAQKLSKTAEGEADKDKKEGDKEEVAEGEKKEGEEAKVEDKEPKGPVPLERFQEVVKARQEVEQKLAAVEPQVRAHQSIVDFCEKANITPKLFNEALEIQSLIVNNPTEALKRLMPLMDHLQGLTGNKLPADLQAEVDSGDLPLPRAKEIAQLRAKEKYGEQYTQMTAKQQQAREMEQFQTTLVRASEAWESQKRKSDPDYKPRAKVTDPMGKHEMVHACFLEKLYAQDQHGNYVNPTRSPEEMTALLDRAYQEVDASFRAQRPKPPVKRPLTRTGSSTNNKGPVEYEKAGSLREAVDMAVAQHT